MKKQPPYFRMGTYVLAAMFLFSLSVILKSCAKTTTPEKIKSVQLANDAILGNILTDSKGYTLYYFSNDVDGASKCTGGCAVVWPPFYDSLLSASTLGTGLSAADFSTLTSSTGAKQTAYKGWPLYYYAPKDANGANTRELVGERKGEKVGNIWFAVKTDYTYMLANKKIPVSGSTDSTTKEFLIDSAGNTLYLFTIDSLKPSTLPTNCVGGCITAWPVFYSPNISVPSLLSKADFGEITRTDGAGGTTRKQSTYRGRPLYYYAPDAFKRGVVNGENVGKVWFVMKPDITKIN